jgi:NADH dehydrogenase FAD-containing subunit
VHRELNRRARGEEPKKFQYHHRGMLAYIGTCVLVMYMCREGFFLILIIILFPSSLVCRAVGGYRALIDSPVIKRSGFLTWIMWNAAYITKLVSIKNKVMIPLYWFKSFVFGRDISRF